MNVKSQSTLYLEELVTWCNTSLLSSSKTSQNDNLEERRQKPLLWTFHHMIRKFSINLVLRNFYCITELVGRQENPKDPQTHIHGKKKTKKK